MRLLALPLIAALAACNGGEDAPEAGANEARRINDQIEKQAAQIVRQAENGTVAIEQALENEQATIFEERGNLLNESGGNAAAPEPERR